MSVPGSAAPAPPLPPAVAPGGHVPALDGVRGLAILLVMWFHQTMPLGWARPEHAIDRAYAGVSKVGWAGVDLFFVLSGFLITGILLRAKGGARYFRNFYARRTLRIFPLYYAVLLAFFVLLPLLPARGPLGEWVLAFRELRGDQAWFWLYLSNVYFALHGWEGHGIPDVLWSLAIEEQFYLVWPAVVLACSRRGLIATCAAIIAMAVLLRTALVLRGVDPIAVYVLTPCRLDALAVGALLAAWAHTPEGLRPLLGPARAAFVLGGAALVILFGLRAGALDGPRDATPRGFEYDPAVQSLGLTLLAIWFGALLVLGVRHALVPAQRPGLLALALDNRALRTLGVYAYALYLFHVPVQSVLRGAGLRVERWPTLAGSMLPGQLAFHLLATGATLGVAIVSWHLFEKHFLKLKRRFETSRPASVPVGSEPPASIGERTGIGAP